jgi:hypothetical protein
MDASLVHGVQLDFLIEENFLLFIVIWIRICLWYHLAQPVGPCRHARVPFAWRGLFSPISLERKHCFERRATTRLTIRICELSRNRRRTGAACFVSLLHPICPSSGFSRFLLDPFCICAGHHRMCPALWSFGLPLSSLSRCVHRRSVR